MKLNLCYHLTVRRLFILLAGILLVISFPKFAGALTDQEKKEAFLKAREEMKTVQPDEDQSAAAHSKLKPKTPVKKPTPKPTVIPEEPHKQAPISESKSTPVVPQKLEPAPSFTEVKPSTHQAPPSAPVVIEKSGHEEAQGLEPPPLAPPSGGFFGFFRTQQYKYITRSIRAELDHAPVARHRWRYIVVHNSGTRQGNARIFDYYHKNVRKMPNGLAYHFVIGNGTSSGNGQIEIGDRWRRQINGGHVHSDYLNNIALGICLVGDFNHDHPTRQQLEALEELIRYLRSRVGRIDFKVAIVKAHREINPPQWPTDCPGDKFPYPWLHSRFN